MSLKLLPALSLLAAMQVHADDGIWTIATGLEYLTGYYDQPERSKAFSTPFIFKYDTDDWGLKVHIPFIESDGPVTGGFGPGGVPLPNKMRHGSGYGDPVITGTVPAYQTMDTLIEIGAKMKIATASVHDGLSTGENDASLQFDIYKDLRSNTLFGTLGYRRMGDPPDVNLRNPWFFTLGWATRTSPTTSVGIAYDYRQRLLPTADPLSESTGFVTWRINRNWKVQSYVVVGFSQVSPDWGGGTLLFYSR